MLLVDTSIWVDHLRQRHQVLSLLGDLAQLSVASDQEVLHMIESRALMGRGVGYIDLHLIAACLISNVKLWTRDQRLHRVAVDLGTAALIQ